jgi:hypothetical protein
MRYAFLFCVAVLGCVSVVKAMTATEAEAKKKVETRTTQTIDFGPGGEIQLDETFGDVTIAGWDKPEVELTVWKGTKKLYGPEEQAQALKALERFSIAMSKKSEHRLLISAVAPSSNLLGQLLKGGANLELSFKLKVPLASNLVIKHKAGDVNVNNIKGNISISNRVGDVALELSGKEKYLVDAKCRLGEVRSAFNRKGRPASGGGSELAEQNSTYQLHVRVGIGEIRVEKLSKSRS